MSERFTRMTQHSPAANKHVCKKRDFVPDLGLTCYAGNAVVD